MKNTIINRKVTLKVAKALGDLNERVVYVGGAVVSLYIDDPSADDVRPTKDIDISLEIASLGELERLRETLQEKGFRQSHEDDVICRFRYEDIKVDVMSTKGIGWAPANPWFAPGFDRKVLYQLEDLAIFLLPLPYFLATKFTAFYDRGSKDPRTSHDFEDIVYLLNHTSNVTEHVINSGDDVKQYVKECFSKILSDNVQQEAIIGNLYHENQMVRFNLIVEKLKNTIDAIK